MATEGGFKAKCRQNVRKAKSSGFENDKSDKRAIHSSSQYESHRQIHSKVVSSCVGEITENAYHRSQPPAASFHVLGALHPGNNELQDNDSSFSFGEENLHIPQLQPTSWKTNSKYDILTLFVNIPETDVHYTEYAEGEWTKLIMGQLNSEVQLEKNNIQLLLTTCQVTRDQHNREYKVLINELEAVRNDIRQYEDYISSECYSFNNETWEYLKNVGRDELRTRKRMYQQQKLDLNQKIVRCWKEIQIYHQILAYLNEEEIKRQQRMTEYSANVTHEKQFRKHLLQNILHRVAEEQKEIQTRKHSVLNEMKINEPSEQNNTDCVLKTQKLGCTFDFMLKHRFYKGGNVHAYNDLVDIFEKRLAYSETPQNVFCFKKLLISALENHEGRLDQEMMLYSIKLKYILSAEEAGQERLDIDKSCPPILTGISDSEGVSGRTPFNLTTPSDLIEEEVCGALKTNRISKVETTNIKEMKKPYSSQPLLQVSSVFRDALNDWDIIPSTLSQLKLEQTSESTCLEMRKEEAKELGSKQQENSEDISQHLKPTAEKRAELVCLKKDVSLAEFQHNTEKPSLQTDNICAEIFEIRKENKRMRKKLDKLLRILRNKNGSEEKLDRKKTKVLGGDEKCITPDGKIGLQVSSLKDMDFGGEGEWITKRENIDMSSTNEKKAELQHLLDDTVAGTKEINTTKKDSTQTLPVQLDSTAWQLHSDLTGSTAREENKEELMTHKKVAVQPHSEQAIILAGEDSDARKRETSEEISRQNIRGGLQFFSDQNLSFEDENSYAMTDHAARKRSTMLIQKLGLLLYCLKADGGVSKHLLRQRIIKRNKSVSVPVINKLIETVTARCQLSVPFHHVVTKLDGKDEVSTHSVLHSSLMELCLWHNSCFFHDM
jgi:hypothetical protein